MTRAQRHRRLLERTPFTPRFRVLDGSSTTSAMVVNVSYIPSASCRLYIFIHWCQSNQHRAGRGCTGESLGWGEIELLVSARGVIKALFVMEGEARILDRVCARSGCQKHGREAWRPSESIWIFSLNETQWPSGVSLHRCTTWKDPFKEWEKVRQWVYQLHSWKAA